MDNEKDIRIEALQQELSQQMNDKVELRMQVVAFQELLKSLGIDNLDDIPVEKEEAKEEE